MTDQNEKALIEGPLERMFKGSAMAKILDFLDTFKDYDYNKTDIAKNSGVNIRTVLRLLPKLEEREIVKVTRTIGKSQMYQFNQENNIAKSISKLLMEIARFDSAKSAQKELSKQQK